MPLTVSGVPGGSSAGRENPQRYAGHPGHVLRCFASSGSLSLTATKPSPSSTQAPSPVDTTLVVFTPRPPNRKVIVHDTSSGATNSPAAVYDQTNWPPASSDFSKARGMTTLKELKRKVLRSPEVRAGDEAAGGGAEA